MYFETLDLMSLAERITLFEDVKFFFFFCDKYAEALIGYWEKENLSSL